MQQNAPVQNSHKEGNIPKTRDMLRASARTKTSTHVDLDTVENIYSCLLLDCFKTLDGLYSKSDYQRDTTTLKKRLRTEGIKFATKVLPDYISVVLSLIDHRTASFSFLKLRKDNRIPRFLGGMTSLVLGSTDPVISAMALNCLYTLCVAFKKLKGEYDTKVLIQQYESFVEVDTNLPRGIDPACEEIAKSARDLCFDFIKNINIDNSFSPKPGPGATNTPTRKNERYSPRVLYKQIDTVLPYADWFYYSPYACVDRSREFTTLMKQSVSEPTARFKFVPKTHSKARGICIEENEMQVLQQAFRNGLWTAIQRSHIKNNLPLTDQTVNASLALTSSLDRTYATIDMSEASDRIPRDLVEYLFQDNEELCEALMALSTRNIEPPDLSDGVQRIPLRAKKYAPMGSGLCFPIMSLVHLFLVQAIILSVKDERDRRSIIDTVRVYGDDIVLPSQYALAVFDLLPRFGMKLNIDKSFVAGHFRESCGIHAYHGMNITPVYIKYIPNSDDLTALQSLLQNESDFYKKGFFETALLFRRLIGKVYPRLNLSKYTAPAALGLVGFYRENTPSSHIDLKRNLKMRRSVSSRKGEVDLQCVEYRVPRFHTRCTTAELTQEESLLRWLWLSTQDSKVVDDGSAPTTIEWNWVPESHISIAPAGKFNLPHSPQYCIDGLIW